MEQSLVFSNEMELPLTSIESTSDVLQISDLQKENIVTNSQIVKDDETRRMLETDVQSLNDEQQHAYDIINWHLEETIAGKKPPQLLMNIPGEGGVGKSRLIQTITRNFEEKGVGKLLVKGAYMGIAASLIDGKTLHVLAGIPISGGKKLAQTIKRLCEFW